MDKFALHLRITNETITKFSSNTSARDLVRIFFFSSSKRFSPGWHIDRCKKVNDLTCCCCCQPSILLMNSQVIASCVSQVTCCLKLCKSLGRVWFFNLCQVRRSNMRTNESVSQLFSQSVSQSVSQKLRLVYKLLFEA